MGIFNDLMGHIGLGSVGGSMDSFINKTIIHPTEDLIGGGVKTINRFGNIYADTNEGVGKGIVNASSGVGQGISDAGRGVGSGLGKAGMAGGDMIEQLSKVAPYLAIGVGLIVVSNMMKK